MSRNGRRTKPRAAQVQKALARAQEKERAKVAVHINRLQQLEAGDKNPHIQQLTEQMQRLVDGHNNLVAAYNTNWKNLTNSIQHLDSRVGAMALVLDDIVRGGIENVTKLSVIESPDGSPEHRSVGGVHWPGYIRMYLKQVEAELEMLKEQQQAEAEATQAAAAPQAEPFDPLITPPEDQTEDDVVFGGKDEQEDGEASTGQSTGTSG